MDNIKIILWNVQGLKSPQKHMMVLRHLRKLGADVAMLQETHLHAKDYFRMRKLWVDQVYGSEAIGRKAVVMILIKKNLPVEVTENTQDDQGRRVSILLKLPSDTIRVTNVYSPNSPPKTYFQQLTTWTLTHPDTKHIIGGDFNSIMTDQEDRKKPNAQHAKG